MILGMVVVFTYLVLMIILINGFKKLLAPLTLKEKEAQAAPPKPSSAKSSSASKKSEGGDASLIAAVTAAIQAYRKSRN